MHDADTEKTESSKMRRDYQRGELLESVVEDNPIDQFDLWFDQACAADILEPNAMTLSTATEQATPSSRIVLLKGCNQQGFRFYSNYGSQKAQELAENPQAALCFFWDALERQVRISGWITKLERHESEQYFRQRPRLSQLGAWASRQSSIVDSRSRLETQFKKVKNRFENEDKIPLPDFWGGYVLKPIRIEFWQGRTGRMHDRICYEKEDGRWNIFRLSP